MIELGNLKLTNGAYVYIQIEDGLIKGVTTIAQTDSWIDCRGWTVVPAGIDGHVHFRDQEERHKEDWNTGSHAALLGGYTLVADMPNKKRPIITCERLVELTEFIGQRAVDYRLWFGATNDNLREMSHAIKHPKVLGVKVYRGSSTGSLLVEEDEPFWKIGELVATANTKTKPVYVASHNEDEKLMRYKRAKLGREPQISDHCQIRDTEVELSSVLKTIQMQRDTGCPVYYCHISTPESLHALYSAKQEGLSIVVEVCAHHVSLSNRGNDPFGKVNPPLRSESQMRRMAWLLNQPDFIDVIGSDHAPHTEGEKLAGGYDNTPSGLTGVQTTIPLLLDRISRGLLSWERFVALTSGNYAALLGINRGKISADREAELTLVDPQEQWIITNESIVSKCQWTPYNGTLVTGAVKAVFTRGSLKKF